MTSLPWHLKINNIEKIWALAEYGRRSFVVIYDTCIDDSHKGLQGKVIKKSQCDIRKEDGAAIETHGTVVASVIVATTGKYKSDDNYYSSSGSLIDVSGVAPKAKIIAYSGIGLTNNPLSRLNEIKEQICRIDKVKESCTYDDLQKVFYNIFINFSKEWKGTQEWYNLLQDLCHEKRLLITAATGNYPYDLDNQGNSIIEPASIKESDQCLKLLVRVGGVKQYFKPEEATKFSNLHYNAQSTDIYAPAEKIASLIPKNMSTYVQGTSEAAPLVAGTLALMSTCHPTISAQVMFDYLIRYSSTGSNSLDNKPLLDIQQVVEKFCESEEDNSNSFAEHTKDILLYANIHEKLFKFLTRFSIDAKVICFIGECKSIEGTEVTKPDYCNYLTDFFNISHAELINITGQADAEELVCII